MVALQTTWSWLPAIYLFLGGMSAGAFITIAILYLVRPGKYDKIVTCGAWVSAIAMAIGLLSLVCEVEKPFQAMNLFASFVNFSSWMTIGAWLIFVAFLIYAAFALLRTFKSGKGTEGEFGQAGGGVAKVLAIIGIPISLAVAIYTGILLAASNIPLWDTWILPTLFTVSALDTGIAAVAIVAAVLSKGSDADELHTVLEKLTIALVVIELAVIAGFIMTMQGAGRDEAVAVGLLSEGALSLPFWALVIGVGLVVPLAAALVTVFAGKKSEGQPSTAKRFVPLVGAACALVGGFALRYVILAAGIHGAMVSPDLVQSAAGILFYL